MFGRRSSTRAFLEQVFLFEKVMNFVIPLCRDVLGMVKGEINTIIDYETINCMLRVGL